MTENIPDVKLIRDREQTRMRWTRGLVWIGSNLFGWMFDSDALAAALRHRPFAYGTHSAVSDLGNVFGEFVLPVAVAILAPKKSFLWAVAALGIDLVWSVVDRVVAWNWPGFLHDLTDNGVGNLGCLLVLCGPISLIRWGVGRHRDRQARRMAEQQAWLQHTPEAQPGVWPPPIRRENASDPDR